MRGADQVERLGVGPPVLFVPGSVVAAALRPEAVRSLTLSEPGTLQLAGTAEAAEKRRRIRCRSW